MAVASPLVSVVLPTYNRAGLLRRAVHSVLAQTYRNVELIVVDDGSTDDTPKVLQSFDDSRLRSIRLNENRRAAAARNVGIREARGELIGFLDDDDVWLMQKLERQVSALVEAPEQVGLNLCSHITISREEVRYVGGARAFAAMDFSKGFGWNFGLIATPGWLVGRRYLELAGMFDERMRAWDDWELALRLSDVCRFDHLDEPLYLQYRLREADGGMWNNRGAFSNDISVIMEKHAARWSAKPSIAARHYIMAGRGDVASGALSAAQGWFGKAVRADLLSYRAWGLLLLSFLGTSPLNALSHVVRSGKWFMRKLGAAFSITRPNQ